MAEWLKDDTLGKRGRPGENRVDWDAILKTATFDFIAQPDKSAWLKILTLPNRNSAPYVRTRYSEWEFATRATLDGNFDWYARPKAGYHG